MPLQWRQGGEVKKGSHGGDIRMRSQEETTEEDMECEVFKAAAQMDNEDGFTPLPQWCRPKWLSFSVFRCSHSTCQSHSYPRIQTSPPPWPLADLWPLHHLYLPPPTRSAWPPVGLLAEKVNISDTHSAQPSVSSESAKERRRGRVTHIHQSERRQPVRSSGTLRAVKTF